MPAPEGAGIGGVTRCPDCKDCQNGSLETLQSKVLHCIGLSQNRPFWCLDSLQIVREAGMTKLDTVGT